LKFSYFDMLTGQPLFFEGVGFMRSPLLEELRPVTSGGVGERGYMLYLTLLSWEKSDIMDYVKTSGLRGWDKVDNERFGVFEIAFLIRAVRELYLGMFSFFIDGSVSWDEKRMCVSIFGTDEDGMQIETGIIDKHNFEEVREALLNLNYVNIDKNEVEPKFTSEKTKALWEQAQKYLKEQQRANAKRDSGKYHLANLISKLCVSGTQYNLFNVYKLTVFQFYDQIFQYASLRRSSLDENIFSNHGGDRFKADGWLNPLNKKV